MSLLGHHDVLNLSHSVSECGQRATLRTLVGDLNDPNSFTPQLSQFKPECCIHLAWDGLPDYSYQRCRANLIASTTLFQVLGDIGCKKIFAAGSCWEYGSITGPMTEQTLGVDIGLFAAHKVAVQLIGQSTSDSFGAQFAWGRIFFVYGPGQRQNSLIPSCYQSLVQGLSPKINNPYAVNDFVHVDDVAVAIMNLLENSNAVGIYNIGSGSPVAVWEVVNIVASEMGLPPVYADMPRSSAGGFADITKLRSLGWQPSVSLKAGIKKTIKALAKVNK